MSGNEFQIIDKKKLAKSCILTIPIDYHTTIRTPIRKSQLATPKWKLLDGGKLLEKNTANSWYQI